MNEQHLEFLRIAMQAAFALAAVLYGVGLLLKRR